jgi:hypothetical protein
MPHYLRRKFILFVSICILLTTFLSISPAFGYGTSIEEASVLSNGSYFKYLAGTDDSAYYKVLCSENDELALHLVPGNWIQVKLAMYLYNSTYVLLDYSADGSVSEAITHTCQSNGYYYIQINRSEGTLGSDFTLTIAGATSNIGIPTFQFLYITYGLLCVLGIVFLTGKKETLIP